MNHPTKHEIYNRIASCYDEIVELRKLARQVATARSELGLGQDGVAHWDRLSGSCSALIECIKLSGLAEIRFHYAVLHPQELEDALPRTWEIE